MALKKRSRIFLYILLALILIGGFLAWKVFGPAAKKPADGFFYVHTGDSYEKVKERLVEEKILSSGTWFNKVAGILDYDELVKPGKYKVDDGMSVFGLVRMLRSGRQTPVKLVIVKIRTKEELAGKLGRNFECDSASILSYLNNPDTLSRFGLDTNTVMTAIIPNTYSYLWNTTPSKLFRRLYSEREKFWTTERKTAATQLGLKPEEVYALASIVEEETNMPEDKGKIASVYLNRMRTGMRLGADPTVKFALRNFALKRIYKKHTEFTSPYNTYQITGLPPGPICTPSIKTIDAVLNAPQTDYLYFVARADLRGFSDFATTYEEHLRYAKAYQDALNREQQKRDSLKK